MHGLEAWTDIRLDYREYLARARMVFVNSYYTLHRHESLYGPLTNARVAWLATEQDQPPPRMATFSGPPTVLLVGRVEATEGWKGHTELIDSWPAVVAAVPRARLVFVGRGTGLDDLRRNARASPAATNIDVLGYVEEAALPTLFVQAHVLAMPSRQEGFGIVYLEAFRYGVPVIASRQDAGREVNVDGETGFNVDLAKPRSELVDHLVLLLRDTDLAARMGKAAHERWRTHFRYSHFAARFLDHWRIEADNGLRRKT
jgi:phosphatidylinositol alpha-1,6-mannosyltransferase